MATPVKHSTTAAYHAQAVISFAVSLLAMGVGIAYLSTGPWVRAFLGLGLLYVVTSAFTLAKVIRDRQDENQVVSRVDQARLDKLLAEHDPFRVDAS
ncbi:YiaA/YiaB family inner membrane protein [Streptacidiphilus cavernicola]|uniref:YiaA/YiaB family inner membrane protein n=1 Tax=Streptacidiphilus cavernicola TaxID=3342716 RepID=A0ABV6W3D4_9ACTN